jgi:hypothetical protein
VLALVVRDAECPKRTSRLSSSESEESGHADSNVGTHLVVGGDEDVA